MKRFVRYAAMGAVLALLFVAAGMEPAGANESEAKARDYVQKLSDQVLALIGDDAVNESDKESRLIELFREHVDTNWMGNFVLGRHSRALTPEQQTRYRKLYGDYLVHSYVPNFKKYTGEKFKILKVSALENGEFMVQTVIEGKGKKPDIRVDYRVRGKGDKFLVTDIIGEGVSLITTQRSDFGGMISQKGVDYFLDRLEEKVTAMLKNA